MIWVIALLESALSFMRTAMTLLPWVEVEVM
jgi:hypothetical protein